MNRTRVIALLLVIALLGCREEKKYHDEKTDIIAQAPTDKIAGILEHQQKLNDEFKDPDESPLPDRFRKDFDGLDFFVPDTSYVVEAEFIRTPDALPFLMPTTTDRQSEEVVYAKVKFELKGKPFMLEVYQNSELMKKEGYEDYLFLPFTDQTNGEETYGGGRYMDLRIPKGNKIILDFNKAYNPYCAYNKKYSCPLVPAVNHMEAKILAGVKKFNKK
ncbi:DUF1684 domain-containing protein [Maribacter cobaltidurans]|uniref:Uncharacterized protein n=1 Tax=Maribacter cobaltidurans TaxID=1178778 RepID=A0A223V2S3_9FLAO|nr:DUF1684 domain-containing protein [Maribacter cobaltidurans]ASV29149.1 hypothetical protein CJ263_02305 [Maribacter cobaltidurans]GGD71514.1 hypothetical protein GCM10011412_06370 [Maribacter cobaltidurans]